MLPQLDICGEAASRPAVSALLNSRINRLHIEDKGPTHLELESCRMDFRSFYDAVGGDIPKAYKD